MLQNTLSQPKYRHNSIGRTPEGNPNPIDVHVGNRIRLRRQLLGLSQEKLAKLLGLTFQQIQKYEKGMNRISASRMWDLAQVLNVKLNFFFEDMSEETIRQSPRQFSGTTTTDSTQTENIASEDPMISNETCELVHNYYRINNRQLAQALYNCIQEAARSIIPSESSKN